MPLLLARPPADAAWRAGKRVKWALFLDILERMPALLFIEAWFSLQKNLASGTVAFSFVCAKYSPIID